MTKKEVRWMAARIVGAVLVISGSALAAFATVVWAGAEMYDQVNDNMKENIELKATHKEDKKDAAAAIEKVRDRIGDMRAEQAATTTQVESNAAILAEVRSDIKTLLSRRD